MRLLVGLILVISFPGPAFSQQLAKPNKVVKEVDKAFIDACETEISKCKPVDIIRTSIKDSVFLIFPSDGTLSEVYVGSAKNKKIHLYDRKGFGEGKPMIRLTHLADGDYTARMISCSIGGVFMIRLSTQTGSVPGE